MMDNQGTEKLKDLVNAGNCTDHKEVFNTVKTRAQILRSDAFFWTSTEVITEVLIGKLSMCK